LFGEIENLLVRANQSARSLSYQLSPPVLYELGLNPALEWLGEEMNRLYRLQVSVSRNHHARLLDERTRIILFRAVRELLVNVAKYAKVRRACVRIRRKGNRVIISVEDCGVGFDQKIDHDPKKARGMGLFGIRERLEYIGGSMGIRSVASKMTSISLSIPIPGER
jgi:two-component system, chemotaxis family, CheB/CheR fusion protein